MAKKESVTLPPTPETRNSILEVIRTTSEPVTASQISKLLVAPNKLVEKKLTPVLDEFVAVGVLRLIPSATAKGKPRYWDRDLATVARAAVVATMQQTQEPLTAKEILSKLASPIKFTLTNLTPILEEQVARQVLHLIPAKTAAGQPRYWNRDLCEFVRVSVLQVLNTKGPQSVADLKKGVKGLSDAQFHEHFGKLISDRVVTPHPPLGKKGKSLFGSQPPKPEPYLHELGTMLTQIVTQLRSADVPVDSLRRALIQLIEAAGVPFGQIAQIPVSAAIVTDNMSCPTVNLVELIRQIDPGADRGALIAPRTLRDATELNKEVFDRAVLDLAATGRISLHRHDYVASLTAAERDDLVTDGTGSYYVGLALRSVAELVK